jgi:hypothetical protein
MQLHTLACIPNKRRASVMRPAFTCCVLLYVLAFATPMRAHSEILLEGSAAAVRLHATQVPIGEILAALRNEYGLRYRASIDLSRRITGTYSGSLDRVVAQLLTNYDFVLKTSSGEVEIPLLQDRGAEPVRAQTSNVAIPRLQTSMGKLRR